MGLFGTICEFKKREKHSLEEFYLVFVLQRN